MKADTKKLLITNCKLVAAQANDVTTSILIEKGIISRIGPISKAQCDGAHVLDARGTIAAPGFIDVHIQGAGGADVLDGTEESLETIAQTCARFGTTGFLATTVFKPGRQNEHIALTAEHVGADLGGANLLGVHIEGPFISSSKRGMIGPDCVAEPSLRLFDEILEMAKGQLRIMTIAPELFGSLDIVHRLTEHDVIASFGHSNASYEETVSGFGAGITHVTHLFNAMSSLHHRAPGPLAAIFETRYVTAQLIADGLHIHPAVLKLAFKLLGEKRVVTITDGMQAMGLGDGKYIYNGIEYECKGGSARTNDGTLIGTAISLDEMVSRLTKFTGCAFETAVKTVTENPARLLGLHHRKGSIAPTKDADIVLLDQAGSVNTTIVGGKIVFQK